MTDRQVSTDLLKAAADKLDTLLADATDGPWWSDESNQYWVLHGVHARIPANPIGIPEQVVSSQILKAPKSSKVFEPYWPTTSDGLLIVTMANPVVGRALSALLRRIAGHDGTPQEPVLAIARAILGLDSSQEAPRLSDPLHLRP